MNDINHTNKINHNVNGSADKQKNKEINVKFQTCII